MAARSLIEQLIPITGRLRSYRRVWLRPDLLAGITLWAVLVPEAMAYAGIAGVPPIIGLYTIPLPLLAYAVFGTSRIMVVGPDSATALLSAATVATLATRGTGDFITLTAALAVLVGALFLLFGLLRLGWVADFVSQPVMQGFITGVVLVTIIVQVPPLLGIEIDGGDFFAKIVQIVTDLNAAVPATVAVGLGSLVLLILIHEFAPKAPAALITVILAIIAGTVFHLGDRGVALVGITATGLPRLALPRVTDLSVFSTLLPGALAIVLLGYAETLGSAKAAAIKTGGRIDPNQEMVALGVANVGAGLSGGFVAVGSFSKTSVAVSTGAKTQLGYLLTAILVGLTLVFLMPVFKNLPLAALAAVVIEAMLALAQPRYFINLWHISQAEFALSMVSMLGVLTLGVLPGIGAGVALSLILLIYSASRPAYAVIGKTASHVFQDVSLHPEAKTIPGLLIFRFEGPLIFSNASYFDSEVRRLVASGDVRCVLLDGEGVNHIDSTAANHLAELYGHLSRRDIGLCLARVRDPVKDYLHRAGVLDMIGEENFYGSITQAVKAYKKRYED